MSNKTPYELKGTANIQKADNESREQYLKRRQAITTALQNFMNDNGISRIDVYLNPFNRSDSVARSDNALTINPN